MKKIFKNDELFSVTNSLKNKERVDGNNTYIVQTVCQKSNFK